jgi:Ca-activated chloride channel family protein
MKEDNPMKARNSLIIALLLLFSSILVAATGGQVEEGPPNGEVKSLSLRPPVLEKATLIGGKDAVGGKTRVHLQWKPSRSTGVVSYSVYRSIFSKKGYRYVGSTKKNVFTDDTAQWGMTYYYVVTAVDISGNESKHSKERKVSLTKEFAKVQEDSAGEDRDRPDGRIFESKQNFLPSIMGSLSREESEANLAAPGEAGKTKRGRMAGARGSYDAFGEPFDEVWVIQKASQGEAGKSREEDPGTGELRAVKPGEEKTLPLPLKHTEVRASITGYIARVEVEQKYQNPYDAKIEAVYVFPLPQNAAVSDFIMTVGDRKIRGIIREREEAKRIYLDARRKGYVASLLTQERPNIFTQRVANIEPGKAIDIDIVYFNTLAYSEGEYSFVFPMVVGPRYNPPGWKDGIGAVGRGSQGSSGQHVEVQYLKPHERSGHDIMVHVDLDAGVSIEKIYSNTHAISLEKMAENRVRVALKPADTIPNKDFVLRYRVAGKKIKSAMMLERRDEGGYFTLILSPPASLSDLPRTPKEMVFVLDCSGSMSGWPMTKAKAAMVRALKSLSPEDTFQIIRFSNRASALGPAPIPATPENIKRGLKYVRSLHGSGGTQMIEGIKAALDFPHDENHFRIVSFMTDGYIGNESQILGEIGKRLKDSRIFSFGVGSSVNRYLIDRMARVGRGAVAYITTGDSLTDISIDWGDMDVYDVYPKTIPDLFVGRPVIITGRYRGEPGTKIRIMGRAGGEKQSAATFVAPEDPDVKHEGISRVWARAKIADLMERMVVGGEKDLREDVKETALTHNLVSAFTAFVAVDDSRITDGDSGTTVFVPVPVPEGVKYETTVTN